MDYESAINIHIIFAYLLGFTQNGSTSGGNVDASQARQDNENMTFQQYEQVTRYVL